EVLHPVVGALEVHALAGRGGADDRDRLADLIDGARETQAVPLADDDGTGQAEPEGEATRRDVIEGGQGEAERHRRAYLHGNDAGGHVEAVGVAQDDGRRGDRVDARRLADPSRVISPRLRLAR